MKDDKVLFKFLELNASQNNNETISLATNLKDQNIGPPSFVRVKRTTYRG